VVTDDEASIREVLADGLESFGWDVTQADTAADAFALVSRGGVDLVLSDIDMPGESGLALLGRIKQHDPDIDVIMVTGVVDLEVAIGAIRQGAADYVTKPFNLEEVQIVIERTLEKRRLIRENREYQLTLEQKVEERTRELEESYESTLEAMITALDFRDNETMGHSRRVVEYAVIVAKTMGVIEPDLSWIRRGAILHDVGKIGVSDVILRKPGKLDASEWEEMKRHPEMGYQMLKHIRFLAPALDIVYCHQERWDGSGYPRGLAGTSIPLGARIFAAVDTFDAMTSDRPYRAAMTIQAARDEIRRFSGIQFDPAIAAAFLSIDEAVWMDIRERVHRDAIFEAQAARASHS
jgi:putative nucleotidyltransferase with HDIG domain